MTLALVILCAVVGSVLVGLALLEARRRGDREVAAELELRRRNRDTIVDLEAERAARAKALAPLLEAGFVVGDELGVYRFTPAGRDFLGELELAAARCTLSLTRMRLAFVRVGRRLAEHLDELEKPRRP